VGAGKARLELGGQIKIQVQSLLLEEYQLGKEGETGFQTLEGPERRDGVEKRELAVEH